MTTREHEETLAPFTEAMRERVGEIFAGRTPDFAAMLARARELDGKRVSAEAVAQAEALAPVIPLARSHRSDDGAVLAPFTAALRADIEGRIHEQRRTAIPAARRPRSPRTGVVMFGLLAAAAALLLWQAPRVAWLQAGTGAVEAVAGGVDGEVWQTAPAGEAAPAWRPVMMPEVVPAIEVPRAARSEDAAATVNADDGPPGPTVTPTGRPRKQRVRPTAPPREEVEPTTSLEDEAQVLWQRGELAAAEQKFREVVRVAGGTARADLAYGDLFVLARQIRGGDGQVAVWREYLAAFPGGRFDDDARAGLCQRSPVEARTDCWREYLQRHPSGSHRRQAEAALRASEEAP